MDQKLWAECINFHGHACPGLAFGYRVSEIAAEYLEIPLDRAKDEEIVCISENEACGVDCIQYILSCTVGKGNLLLRITGKAVYTFFNRADGKGVRISVKNFDRDKYSRAELIEYILNCPAEELFKISKPQITVPPKAKLFQSIICEKCGEAAREDKIRIQEGKRVCLDCFEAYERHLL